MKKIITLLAISALALSLYSCNKSPSPSSLSSSSQSEAQDSSSQSEAQDSSLESSSSQSTSSQSSTSAVTSEGWPTSFISLKDASGQIVLVEVKAPVDWTFDKSSTFFLNDIKILEIGALETIADKSNPLAAAYKDQYSKNPEGIPEGFGIQSSEEITLETCRAVLHKWTMWPDNSEVPWYLHSYLVEKGDYLVPVTFYSFDENCNTLHKTYDVVLNDIAVFK